MNRYLLFSIVLAVMCLCIGSAFAGATYGFNAVTNNNDNDVETGRSQIFVEVNRVFDNSEQAMFTFTNTGPENSFIADVLFFQNSFLSWDYSLIDADQSYGDITGDGGVDFSYGSRETKNYSRKYDIYGYTYVAASASFDKGHAGVDIGESLGVIMTPVPWITYDNVLNALNDGSLSIGIKVQGFDSGGSERFISGCQVIPSYDDTVSEVAAVVPVPGSVVLGLLGIGSSVLFRRKISLLHI